MVPARVIRAIYPNNVALNVTAGSMSTLNCSIIEPSADPPAGTHLSLTAKKSIKTIPIANSGVTARLKPVTVMILSDA